MSADNQLALSRFQRPDAGGFNRTARHMVPPFLQKLYGMVSDPATDELIRWSDSGDSFVVLDHERVAHDVLPRWFKHNNFNSFVRQLNMYGFHKIPHLQQGVLRSDAETEVWNFENPNFHRGQPDLLCLISRKKQASERSPEDSQIDGRDPANSTATMSASGPVLDVNQIVSGIAAIKRHQAAISADLNDLKASNEHLWKEAIAARDRHTVQQDTINRILKFLGGVFGQSSPSNNASNKTPPQPVYHRKRQPLLIEGAQNPKNSLPAFAEVSHSHELSSTENEPDEDEMSNRFSTVEPMSALPSPLPPSTSTPTPSSNHTERPLLTPPDNEDAADFSSSQNIYFPATTESFVAPDLQQNNEPLLPTSMNMLTTPSTGNMNPNSNETVLQSILGSAQQQQQLQSILSMYQNRLPLPVLPMDNNEPPSQASSNQFQAYLSDDFHQAGYLSPDTARQSLSGDFNPQLMALISPKLDNTALQPVVDSSVQLQKKHKDVEAISADVNALQTSIDLLLQNFGLDPETVRSLDLPQDQQSFLTHDDPVIPQGVPAVHTSTHTSGSASDFDFDSLFNPYNNPNDGTISFDDISQMPALTSNEVTQSGLSISPMSVNGTGERPNSHNEVSPLPQTKLSVMDSSNVSVQKRGSKRKSTVLENASTTRNSPESNVKRKK